VIEWLRPAWLLALPLGLALLWAWWHAHAGTARWRRVVDAELLPHLTGRAGATSARLAAALAVIALVLVCAALAGPTWRVQPASLYRDFSARIVVLDLSPSMDAVDVAPSRLERARMAIVALLRDSADAQLGLVVFGADAFTVAPLVNDPAALVHLLARLETGIVPRAGARPDLGLETAREMLERAGVVSGDVILVGDSAGDARTLDAARALARAGFPLSVLAVGTPQGGPVRTASGVLAKTAGGEIFVTRPDFAALERVARAGGGRFHRLATEGHTPRIARGAQVWAAARDAPEDSTTLRRDDGAWLALLALPFAALLFRRGWLLCIAGLAVALPSPEASAFEWTDLWHRADQQAAAAFAKGQYGDHARLVSRLGHASPWRAPLLYRSGRFAEAAAAFAQSDTADAHYNRGNALALEGRLEAALEAYANALERRPQMRDALFNRALVREALARRRAQAQAGEHSPDLRRSAPAQPARRSEPGASGQAARSGPQARASSGAKPQAEQDRVEPVPQADGERDSRFGGPDAAELRRLERLLAQVPDDPGSLLATRFLRQLRVRGVRQHDTGEPW